MNEELLNKIEEFLKKELMKCATDTAQQMWEEKINYQIDFYNRLKNQVDHSF